MLESITVAISVLPHVMLSASYESKLKIQLYLLIRFDFNKVLTNSYLYKEIKNYVIQLDYYSDKNTNENVEIDFVFFFIYQKTTFLDSGINI